MKRAVLALDMRAGAKTERARLSVRHTPLLFVTSDCVIYGVLL